MRLYHGGLAAVPVPVIMNHASYRPLDFGTGFYTTSNEEQAVQWVRNRLDHMVNEPSGQVSVYEFDESGFTNADLRRLDFPTSSVGEDWFRFVMRNRRERNPEHGYDLVTGPVANDRVYTVLSAFEAGFMDEASAIARMKPYRLANQYLFHTTASLRHLRFLYSKEVRR